MRRFFPENGFYQLHQDDNKLIFTPGSKSHPVKEEEKKGRPCPKLDSTDRQGIFQELLKTFESFENFFEYLQQSIDNLQKTREDIPEAYNEQANDVEIF